LLASDVKVDALVPPAIIIFFFGCIRCLEGVTGSLDSLAGCRVRLGRSDGTTPLVLPWVLLEATAHRGFAVRSGSLCQIDGLYA
jgi:hypothetical protein